MGAEGRDQRQVWRIGRWALGSALVGAIVGGVAGWFLGGLFLQGGGRIACAIAGAVGFAYLGGIWGGLSHSKVGAEDPEATDEPRSSRVS